jgi:glycosyltransferase involved in cell wall biosynthesis
MRICHFCTSTIDTHYFENLGKGLAANGMSVFFGTLQVSQEPAWIRDSSKIKYFSLQASSKRRYPLAVIQLARFLRTEKIDILQTHLFDAGIVGVCAARLARVPLTIVTRHHTDEAWLIGSKVHVLLYRIMAHMSDHIIVLSNAVKHHMISKEKVPENKIEVIYQGFNFESLSPTDQDRERIRSEFGFGSDFVIGYVARFFTTKGHRYLLKALGELAKKIPEIRLFLLGDGDRTLLTELIRHYGVQDRVILAGYRNDVAACMGAMDVVVHPSLTEAFCQAHIEALSSGTALIATNVAAAPEVITQRETGMLIPPANPGAIVDAVLELYRQPDLRKRISLAGQQSVRSRFTVDRMINHQFDCYRRWLKDSMGRA